MQRSEASGGIARPERLQGLLDHMRNLAHPTPANRPHLATLPRGEHRGKCGDKPVASRVAGGKRLAQPRRPYRKRSRRRGDGFGFDAGARGVPGQIIEAFIAPRRVRFTNREQEPVAAARPVEIGECVIDGAVRCDFHPGIRNPSQVDLPDPGGNFGVKGERGAGNPPVASGHNDYHLIDPRPSGQRRHRRQVAPCGGRKAPGNRAIVFIGGACSFRLDKDILDDGTGKPRACRLWRDGALAIITN